MVAGAIEAEFGRGVVDRLIATARADGSLTHPYTASRELLSARNATRNLADAVHHLCILHGRHPGIIDIAAERSQGEAGKWLSGVAEAFAQERTWLTKLVVAAGPIPSTAHQAESEAAVVAQGHALEMLAHSDRAGCALGAALALLLDWHALRLMLDVAADRFGLAPIPYDLPRESEIRGFAGTIIEGVAMERALLFGAQQLLIQHRGLWDLLESREQARLNH
jgi:hypothetical protein